MGNLTVTEICRRSTEMAVALSETQGEQILHYLALLEKWNRTINLTAIKGQEQQFIHHILDSFTVLPFLQSGWLLDVGSGAGLPGIPVAIAQSDLQVVMLDSNGKKCKFIQQVIVELGLRNATVVHSRIENFQDVKLFQQITSRAFTSLPQFLAQVGLFLLPEGQILAMKGKWPEPEANLQLDKNGCVSGTEFKIERVESVSVPDLNAERHMVVCQRTS